MVLHLSRIPTDSTPIDSHVETDASVHVRSVPTRESAAVATASEPVAGIAEEVAFWPILGIATLGISAVMMISITLVIAMTSAMTWTDGLGVAAFATMWGGPGFGLMFGGAAWTVRQHKADEMASSAGR